MNRVLLIVVIVVFGTLTSAAVAKHGVMGIFQHQFQNLAGWQVLVDLAIALTLFLIWMWRDAKLTRRNPWPWIALTLVAGSFGPLLYLLFSRQRDV